MHKYIIYYYMIDKGIIKNNEIIDNFLYDFLNLLYPNKVNKDNILIENKLIKLDVGNDNIIIQCDANYYICFDKNNKETRIKKYDKLIDLIKFLQDEYNLLPSHKII